MDILKENSPGESAMLDKMEERPSSPNDCAICLEQLTDKSFTNSCLHMFCFHCLLAWSKVKPECPLCKQDFCSIIHNIRSMTDYDEYHVPPSGTGLRITPPLPFSSTRPIEEFYGHNHNFFNDHRRFFSYRTTIMSNGFNIPRERPSNLVIQPYVDNLEIQNNFSRLNSSQSSFSRTNRREIYLKELQTHPPPSGGRYRECSPEFYRENEAQVHRLGRWVNRELMALSQIGVPFVQHELQHLIMDMLRVYNITSDVFHNLVNRYLGVHTSRFIREFYNFATSPFEIEQYDRECVYVRQRNGSHLSFIVTVGRDDSEDVQVIPNNTLNQSVQPWIDVNDLNTRTYHMSGSGLQISARVHRNTCQRSRPTSSNNPTDLSQSVINISDSENDDCVIIEEVRTMPETIVLDDSDYEHQSHSKTTSVRQTLRSNNTSESSNAPLDLSTYRNSCSVLDTCTDQQNIPTTSQISNSVVASTSDAKKEVKLLDLIINKIKCRKRSVSTTSSVLSTDISSDENEQKISLNDKNRKKKYKRSCKIKNSKKGTNLCKHHKKSSDEDYTINSAGSSSSESDKNWESSDHKRKKKSKKPHSDKHEKKKNLRKRKKSISEYKSQKRKKSVSISDSCNSIDSEIKYEKKKKTLKKSSSATSSSNKCIKTAYTEPDSVETLPRLNVPKLRSIVKKVNNGVDTFNIGSNRRSNRNSYDFNSLPSTSRGFFNGYHENRFYSENFFKNVFSSDSD